MEEEWTWVYEYPMLYLISNMCVVKSCIDRGRVRYKVLTPKNDGRGYYHYILRDGMGKKRTHMAHKLVMESFVGPRPHSEIHIRHLDGNPSNNCLSNLAYGTAVENAADKILHGTDAQGSKNKSAKLHETDIPDIRRMLNRGAMAIHIADIYGVTPGAIDAIKQGRTWVHV